MKKLVLILSVLFVFSVLNVNAQKAEVKSESKTLKSSEIKEKKHVESKSMKSAEVKEVNASKSDAKNSEITLSVKMHCESCCAKVKKELANTKGVTDVVTNLEKQTVFVKYNSEKTTVDNLILTLDKAGYKAEVQKTSSCNETKQQNSGCAAKQQQGGCAKQCPNSKKE